MSTGLGVTPTLLLTNERCGLTNSLNLTQLAHPKNGDRRLVLWGAVYINMQRVWNSIWRLTVVA